MIRHILKGSIKVGIASIIGILSMAIAGKIMAVQLGAVGVGIFGMLRQLLQNLTLLGTFNGQTAIIQGIASRTDRNEQLYFSRSILFIQLILSICIASFLLITSAWIGPSLIPIPNGVILLRWLALVMLVMVAQTYSTSLLSGHQLIDELVKVQILGPVALLLLIYPTIQLIRRGHPVGFILILGGPGLAVLGGATLSAWRAGRFPRCSKVAIRRIDGIPFFRMSAILTMTGAISTGVQFGQSWMVAKWMGLAQVGQFWTAWTLSMTYVTLVLGSLGTYYMPNLSRLQVPQERKDLIRVYFRFILMIMPLVVSAIIVFKPLIVKIMFASAMLPALKIMRWMLIGDFLKGISYVLAFPMVAFRDLKWFFWSDALFSAGMGLASWILMIRGGGIEGLGLIFMLTYLFYLPVMIFYIWRQHGFKINRDESFLFLTGLALVTGLSACTWTHAAMRWSDVANLIIFSTVFSVFALRGAHLRALSSK